MKYIKSLKLFCIETEIRKLITFKKQHFLIETLSLLWRTKNRLREMVARIAPILGCRVKVVERTGATLKSKFSQSSLWEGMTCGREDCVTCLQGAEFQVPCTRKSMVNENICGECNKGASGKDEVKMEDPDIPSIYVGESSRTIRERAKEHWGALRGNQKAKEGSHMYKHQ